MPEQTVRYKSLTEIEDVVRRFETCAYAPDEFHHAQHLIVAFWYLKDGTQAQALERMRLSLLRFVNHHRLEQVYHETITLFWLKIVGRFLKRCDNKRPLADLVNELIEDCGDPQLIYSYFTKVRLDSAEGRERWIEPDAPLGD